MLVNSVVGIYDGSKSRVLWNFSRKLEWRSSLRRNKDRKSAYLYPLERIVILRNRKMPAYKTEGRDGIAQYTVLIRLVVFERTVQQCAGKGAVESLNI